ncbi:hypothetical protein GH714_038924 [Hevea brasiliensis]|uniref:C2H2-type domain-containing protein n=1 Tax=Hevea brasiliensis TaxID=3981 RepID=A0A6A6KNK7_HEVBR|nr:hypothetical protein GH714_038924 [Hevea brasiliensis]
MDAQQVMASEDLSHTNIIKGKRTKRQRLPLLSGYPSLLALLVAEIAVQNHLKELNNMSSATTMTCPVTSIEFAETGGEEEDMANCLILLAQGSSLHNQTRKLSEPAAMATSTTAVNKESGSWRLYRARLVNEFSSGQALGGHMRRHRAAFATTSTTTTTTRMNMSLVTISCESQESKKPRNSLELDLNLPAREDDLQELNFHFGSKEQVLVFSASSLVDCHY